MHFIIFLQGIYTTLSAFPSEARATPFLKSVSGITLVTSLCPGIFPEFIMESASKWCLGANVVVPITCNPL